MIAPLYGSKAGITVAAMCAAMMAFLDISIVNVSLSNIRASFGVPLDKIGWISTSYMLANVVAIPLTGWFQRRLGYRPYFAFSVVLFTLASALCGLSWNLPSLVFFRILQGIGGGAVIPTAQAILLIRYPREEHGMAGALFGLGAIAGPMLGPSLGGYLTEAMSWRWIFFINVPLGCVALFMALSHLQERRDSSARPSLDVAGMALMVIGLGALEYVLEEGHREGWTAPPILFVAAVAAICLITFAVRAFEAKSPLLDFSLLADRNYAIGTVINMALGVSLFGGLFLFALFCGTVLRYSAADTGRVFLVGGVVQLFLMPIIGRISHRVPGRLLLTLGVALMAWGLFMNAQLDQRSDFASLVSSQIIRAVAMTLVFIPLGVMTLAHIAPSKRGDATALFSLTRELGGSIGTACLSARLDGSTARAASRLGERMNVYDSSAVYGTAAIVGRGAEGGLLPLVALKQRAVELAFGEAFRIVGCVCVAIVALIVFFRPGRPARSNLFTDT